MNAFPYFSFNGNCLEAVQFYAKVLNASLKVTTFKEAGAPVGEKYENGVMNAQITKDNLTIMASDIIPEMHPPLLNGSDMTVGLVLDSYGDAETVFNELAKDAKAIGMPFQKVPWADGYGMLVDRYNVGWQINGGYHPEVDLHDMQH
jgi:PhnB protein